MKELIIENVRQIHIESGKDKTITVWLETTSSDCPMRDIKTVEKEDV